MNLDYLQVLKIFRPYYGKNQKYYSEIHPILYYNDDFYTNPFNTNNIEKKEEKEVSFNNVKKYIDNYKVGYNRSDFFKLFIKILKDNKFELQYHDMIQYMIRDFDTLNLYKEYDFKQHKISRNDLRNIIKEVDCNRFEFIQFCADYFSFTFIILDPTTYKIYYPRNDPNILSPKLILYHDNINERFYHIRIHNNIWLNSNNELYKKYFHNNRENRENEKNTNISENKKVYDKKSLTKLKVVELQEIAKTLNIEIQKLNPKKTRMINKRKNELINEILSKN